MRIVRHRYGHRFHMYKSVQIFLFNWVQGDNKYGYVGHKFWSVINNRITREEQRLQHTELRGETYPCLSRLFGLFFVCKLSSDFVVYRLFCNIAEDELFVGDVTTKSPVLFHRFARPVGLPILPTLLCDIKFVVDDWWLLLLLLILFILFILLLLSCNGAAVECTVAGRGSGDAAGDVLLWESAECSEPFDWWCNERRFKFVTFVLAWNLEGEFVVLFVLLPLLLKRQSSSVVDEAVVVICDERTEKIK